MDKAGEITGVGRAVAGIVAVSGAAIAFLVWILYFGPEREAGASSIVAALPAVNAGLNALSATSVVSGLVFIRWGMRRAHMACMMTAFTFSALFFISYVVYHQIHGDTTFLGEGWVRPVYFFVLISHIGLTTVALPMILTTFYFALTKRFAVHKRLARTTYPLWLYVSVTGVIIFFMLRAHS